jgi:hypothetical protein
MNAAFDQEVSSPAKTRASRSRQTNGIRYLLTFRQAQREGAADDTPVEPPAE